MRNADRIDLNSYEEYMGLLNMFEDDAFGHAEQRSRPRFFGILEDTFKSFFGLKDVLFPYSNNCICLIIFIFSETEKT